MELDMGFPGLPNNTGSGSILQPKVLEHNRENFQHANMDLG